MKCHECNRKVRNSFTDKLMHVMQFHPERIMHTLEQWPVIGRAIGHHIGEQTRKIVMEYATKRNLSK